ncbi:hypothetical protein [Flammeovirga kamogawensis]|uniref:Uncharacterized protein n=1 Tax=Flammeovirga kamogawensis TaxID=373891 RepID=A0ABX8GVV5_9BACT|nr:hypothetical protein [Flammeovirga kamogawensis]MBB6461614.1 hypothetical protein [Flammeovirga kamogawensis]QWG07457.1 hypothetical protein KM029_00505 [Flammeovirga kamogawensis]TRX69269.1 hypothetical protein EO216_14450 [Flammeovirga kamogawensis]
MPNGKYVAEYAQKLAIARKKLASSTEKRSFIFHYKRIKYTLYADRTKIYWLSDANRDKYIFSPYYKMRRLGPKKIYNLYYGFIMFHYMDNGPLYQFLYAHLRWKRKVRQERRLQKEVIQNSFYSIPPKATINFIDKKAA